MGTLGQVLSDPPEEEKSMNVAENQLPYQTRQDKPK